MYLHPPAGYVEGEGKEAYGAPIGAGPTGSLRVTNQRIVAEVNPPIRPRPAFNRIVWRIIPDQLTA
jgi:hypothetical protein